MQVQYHRLNVYDYVLEFCGWEPIEELIKYAGNPVKENYLIALIKTGARAGEALFLEKENFGLNKRTKTIIVNNMKLEKRWRLIKNPDGSSYRQHIEAIRKPFPILMEEPLSKELIERLDVLGTGRMFTSPYKAHEPLTVSWGYKFIRGLNNSISRSLFNQLGLNQPFRDKITSEPIADVIHLWQHWFRAQRASQLRSEYGYTEADLMEFFGWLDYKTALHYSRLGASNLARKARAAIHNKF
jgi:hypothetical protein